MAKIACSAAMLIRDPELRLLVRRTRQLVGPREADELMAPEFDISRCRFRFLQTTGIQAVAVTDDREENDVMRRWRWSCRTVLDSPTKVRQELDDIRGHD